MKKFSLIILLCGLALMASAKSGKIKYGKFLIYEGEVVDKQPSGVGTLKGINPENKKEYAFTIEGVFNGSAVTDPHIKSNNGMPVMNVKGVVVVEMKGEKKKVESLNLLLKNVTITDFDANGISRKIGTEFCVDELILNQCVVNGSNWKFSYDSNEVGLDMNEQKFSEVLTKMGRQAELRMLRLKPEKIFYVNRNPDSTPYTLSTLGYKPYKEHLALRISDGKFIVAFSWYSLNNQGTFLYADQSFANTQVGSKFSSDGKSWKGTRTLDDGTFITKSEGEWVEIVYANGNKFFGTIKGGTLQMARAGFNIAGVKYNKGNLYRNGKEATRYLLGEPYDSLHNRLKSELCDSLVEKVENEEITETEAVKLQRQIDKERQEALQRQAELRKMMNSRWGAEAVLFSGKIIPTPKGANAWRDFFGINPAFFTGEAILALDCFGMASFVFVPTPSELSYNQERGRLLQINSFCQHLVNVVEQDRYRIEDHKLYIGDKEIGAFSVDWKTFTHTEQGMLKTTMKVTKREKISEDGSQHTIIQ